MSDWDSMQQLWQSVDGDSSPTGAPNHAAALGDRLRKRSRWVRWYMGSELICAPFALMALAWAWTIVDRPFERVAIITLAIGIAAYFLAIFGAYRRQRGTVPVRPWAIRAQMLKVTRFWLTVCRSATLLFLVMLPIPLFDALARGLEQRWPYLLFSILWATGWIVLCQIFARRLWQRSRAYCIGTAKSARYRIF
ncbi:MAG: hypothetical protein KAG72_04500 [Abyssibacter sp.]|nr:hypothetical protein [Abyssibacter sp.]MCK5858588.1 hypothetical protein [Abyssibacter sp.]